MKKFGLPTRMLPEPEVIMLPVVLNCKPARNPVIINESPTLIALCDNFAEISMSYEYERNVLDPGDVATEDAWKLLAQEAETVERETVKIWHHVIIKKKNIRFINMQWDLFNENWYVEFDSSSSPVFHVEKERGEELFSQLITWWKKK